ncbi:mediator of RNA polymerase II transcription subunit 10 isoform X2 [Narcine bancroftii]|uniref:mediator of RNA polymerase II transcription subunit 10 isoform X2 n=1 Tax=Narcine bancroftii TaxID=1343680 RepID=UPI0038310682
MAEKFDSLEEHLEKFIENIRQLGIIVSDFQPSSQAGLNQKLNSMISGLQDVDKCRQQLHDINVPLEVFEYIDQGRNPQLYTKECLERALAKNEQVKGKIDTLKIIHNPLSGHLKSGKLQIRQVGRETAAQVGDLPDLFHWLLWLLEAWFTLRQIAGEQSIMVQLYTGARFAR